MGVGYQVSPIHRLIRVNTAGLKVRPASPGESPLFDAIRDATGSPAQVSDEPLRTRHRMSGAFLLGADGSGSNIEINSARTWTGVSAAPTKIRKMSRPAAT